MPFYRLPDDEIVFPNPRYGDKEGLIAMGGDLSPERLLFAYEEGLFPWYSEDDPILWWSPDPRFVLYPDELKVAKSMRPYFNQQKYQVTIDTAFPKVIQGCKEQKRKYQRGTWITDEMEEAYIRLHKLGYAHSVEVWDGTVLVGGLYGVSLGKMFFGESMFTRKTNASKFGFIVLVKKLRTLGFWLIDAQQKTRHLRSLGAKEISRDLFLDYLQKNKKEETLRGNWSTMLQK